MKADTGDPERTDALDARRTLRWALVAAGLFAALTALAFGSWWGMLAIMCVTLPVAIWALLS